MTISQADIERLLQGRVIIDNYRAKDSQGVDESDTLPEKLKAIGFTSDNPVQEFHDFNKNMLTEAFTEMGIQGDCDFCIGYDGTPKCVEIWGSRACYHTKIDPKQREGSSIAWSLIASAAKGFDGASDDWDATIKYYESSVDENGIYWFCPRGHGFYIDTKELRRKFHSSSSCIGKFSLLWR